jgi:hypothetical protein
MAARPFRITPIAREALITISLGVLLALAAGWAATDHDKTICDPHAGFFLRGTHLACPPAMGKEAPATTR